MLRTRFAALLLAFFTLAAQAAPARVVRDMAGDAVAVPAQVGRVATIGPVPVLNSLVFAVGEGRRLVNGLPAPFSKPRWAYQAVFAPHIAALPPLQNADHSPNLEALLRAAPDVVLTMDRASAEKLRQAGLPALYVAWRRPDEVKAAVRLLGELFGKQQAAERYAAHFDATLAAVGATLTHAAPARPRVLYFNPTTLTQPHLVAEWWIRAAGADSVTDDGRAIEARTFSLEQLLAWDPDILVVSSAGDARLLRREPRYAGLRAVRGGRVLVAPCGAHTWANRTSEQALTVLWAARQFHPGLFSEIDLIAETQRFYRDFFGSALTAAQAKEILAGGR